MVRQTDTCDSDAAMRELLNRIKFSSDNFDKIISDVTKNKADLGSHYNLSPERYRYFVNGTRKFLIYDLDFSEPTLIDNDDDFTVDIGTGSTARLETAERYRYPVGYVVSASWAETVSQPLQTGDLYVRGLGNPDIANVPSGADDLGPAADGWFLINLPSMSNDEVKLAIYRDGSEQASKITSVKIPIDSTKKSRYEFRYDWYNVGSVEFRETYTENGEQINKAQAELAVDDDDGPKDGNKKVTHAVKKENTGFNAQIGSFGLNDLGDIVPILKEKTAEVELTYSTSGITNASTGDWIPLLALKESDELQVVNAQLASMDIVNKSSTSEDVQVVAIAVDENNTDASGFSTPGLHAERNSVVEETTSVSTVPDPTQSDQDTIVSTEFIQSSGNGGDDNVPGWQIGYASNFSSGQGVNTERTGTSRVKKRNFYANDNVVIMVRASTDGISFNLEYVTEQQW